MGRYHFRDLAGWRDNVTRADMEALAASRREAQREKEVKDRLQKQGLEKLRAFQAQMRAKESSM